MADWVEYIDANINSDGEVEQRYEDDSSDEGQELLGATEG